MQGGVIQQISLKAPISSPVPADGYILRAHGQAADFIASHMFIGQRVDASYRLLL